MIPVYLFTGKGKLHIQNTRTPFRFYTLCGRFVYVGVEPGRVEALLKRFKVCQTCKRESERTN